MNCSMTPMTPDIYADFGENAFVDAVGSGVLGVFVFVYLMVLFLIMAFSVVSYVFHSLGLYTIADRRGIRHSWLAWVPLGNIWLLGSISDQYQYIAKGKIKNRRKVMLSLSIGIFAIYFIWLVSMIASLFSGEELTAVAGIFVGTFVLLVVAVILAVLEYLAYYDLFNSCHPSNGALYLILSIVFPVTLPFLVFACRKKDLGMPPRKRPVVQEIVEPVQVAEESAAEPEEGFAQPEEFEE